MRFRGKILDIGCIQQFTHIINTLSKLVRTCVMRITPDKIFFILAERVGQSGTQIWCELPQGNFFDEYALEGMSQEYDEIYLELAPDLLLKSMRTANSAKWIKIKLTKKHSPCLTLEVDLASSSSHQRLVVHDVPVMVIPRRQWDDYAEPEMPDFDVSISMPQLKVLKNVVDKMKNLSNYVFLMANTSGDMKLSVETDMVAVTTHFQGLFNPSWRRRGDEDKDSSQNEERLRTRDPQEFATARIDIKRFALFLNSQQVNPNKVVCSK